MTLPKYRCHKIVEAAPIIGFRVDPGWVVLDDDDGSRRRCDPKIFARYTPVPGDYFVQYEDGYQSISPKAAFEAGYTRIEE